jgi:hypothetical protein
MRTSFLMDQSGAVTVDWTVLTAAIVGLGLTAAAAVRTGTTALGSDVEASLSNAAVASLGRMNWAEVGNAFDTNLGDVTVVRNGGNDQITWSAMLGPDGKPGVMMFNDRASNDAWVDMGAAFKGNHADKYGGTLSWDVNIVNVGGTLLPAGPHFVEIRGTNGTVLRYSPPNTPTVGEWSNVSAALSQGSLRLSNGTVATEAQIRSVLADVDSTSVRVEYVNGGESIAFDNFRFR